MKHYERRLVRTRFGCNPGVALCIGLAAAAALVLPHEARADVDASANEGDKVNFSVKIPAPAKVTTSYANVRFRYSYDTEDDSAVDGTHYDGVSGKVEFDSPSSTATVSVQTHSDNTNQKTSRDFYLELSDPEWYVPNSFGQCCYWRDADLPVHHGMADEFELKGRIIYW